LCEVNEDLSEKKNLSGIIDIEQTMKIAKCSWSTALNSQFDPFQILIPFKINLIAPDHLHELSLEAPI